MKSGPESCKPLCQLNNSWTDIERAETMELRSQRLFLALILTQVAHSIEEYVFRLYEVLAPARIISGLVSSNLAVGFASVNAALILFGFWCYFARVRKSHRACVLSWGRDCATASGLRGLAGPDAWARSGHRARPEIA